jgi:hypothetical protein
MRSVVTSAIILRAQSSSPGKARLHQPVSLHRDACAAKARLSAKKVWRCLAPPTAGTPPLALVARETLFPVTFFAFLFWKWMNASRYGPALDPEAQEKKFQITHQPTKQK